MQFQTFYERLFYGTIYGGLLYELFFEKGVNYGSNFKRTEICERAL